MRACMPPCDVSFNGKSESEEKGQCALEETKKETAESEWTGEEKHNPALLSSFVGAERTDCSQIGDALRVIESSILQIKWRLRPSSKSRLVLDLLAVSTGLRPAVMVDYGGHGSELQEHLCRLLNSIQKGSSFFEPLKVMIIQEMIYVIHVRGLAEYALSSLSSEQLLFVDLDNDPPKMILQSESEMASLQLKSIQKMIFSVLFVNNLNNDLLVGPSPNLGIELLGVVRSDQSGGHEYMATKVSELMDLSSCKKDLQITLPTLNGWILGYPVVYLFTMDHAADAVSNLSAKALHIYSVLVCRNGVQMKEKFQELMSFTVPCELSSNGQDEAWARSFLNHLSLKIEASKQVWKHLKLEVSECYPQSSYCKSERTHCGLAKPQYEAHNLFAVGRQNNFVDSRKLLYFMLRLEMEGSCCQFNIGDGYFSVSNFVRNMIKTPNSILLHIKH